jgi:A/G-specific adenine glycosylase
MAPDLTSDLLAWYAEVARDLPWRKTHDPYAIWVSEIVLHQTQVATGLPYYERLMARFPTVSALAEASLSDVLKAWEGLGYYARARNLHAAARIVVAEHGGHVPDTFEALRRLPGVGDYTANAVLSIAFGQDRAAVDGNVRRVLARVFAVIEDIAKSSVQRQIEELATGLVPPGRAGEFNQALMDLGASICIPRRPRCLICPIKEHCEAFRRGIQEQLPIRAPRKETPHYDVAAAVIWLDAAGETFLIAQRPLRGLLGGLWEFPGGKCEAGETLQECLRREIREELQLEVEVGELLIVVEHAYTHFRITLYAFSCRLVAGEPRSIDVADWRWITLADIDSYAFSAADLQIIRALRTAKQLAPHVSSEKNAQGAGRLD